MALHNHIPGINTASQYQVSGLPFTHSAGAGYTITLKRLAKAVTITSTGADNTVAFGIDNETPLDLPSGGSVRLEVKCKTIIVTVTNGTVGVCAELTGIPVGDLPTLDASDFGTVS